MKKHALPERDALRFLKDNITGVMATCFDDQPHATTIYYDVDDDFNFYYLTKRNTQKNVQAAFNPSVAIAVGTGPEHVTVQARGMVELLTEEEKTEVINRMIVRYTKMGVRSLPIHVMQNLRGAYIVAYKLVPDELVFMNMDSKKYNGSVSDKYYKII